MDLHNAYLDCANGSFSKRPSIEFVIPSLLDPTLAPPDSNKLVAYLFVQYAPCKLSGGREWDQETKSKFIKNTFDLLDEYAPNFSSIVEFKDVVFPSDLEQILNMTGGDIFHGAMSLSNLFISRPMPKYNDYKWPLSGMWSCGSSNHPGGGVMGAPGRNCALRIIDSS